MNYDRELLLVCHAFVHFCLYEFSDLSFKGQVGSGKVILTLCFSSYYAFNLETKQFPPA